MSEKTRDGAVEHGLGDPIANPVGDEPIDPSLGSGTPDTLVRQGASTESVGDPGSDDSPRGDATESVVGGSMNSGPNNPDFEATEELRNRAQRSAEPGKAADEGVPAEQAEESAAGDNLRP